MTGSDTADLTRRNRFSENSTVTNLPRFSGRGSLVDLLNPQCRLYKLQTTMMLNLNSSLFAAIVRCQFKSFFELFLR